MSGWRRWDLLSKEQKVAVTATLDKARQAKTLDEIGDALEAAIVQLDEFVPVRPICDTVWHIRDDVPS